MTERKPADSTPDTWADLRGILKGKGNGARLTIEEMNEAIADAWAEAGMCGITPDNRHAEVDFGRPVGREVWPPYENEDSPAPADE
ncbi:hypothetical protein BAR24066_07382 [Burkholderia arboris]|uniref:Uncharacterized protein n=1 Tax=Burkholderia arboris TaxID=488730 RepID=A0A9Q9SRN2_9BURK|nr:hypothetical protein [Burkholderia arboris]VWC46179.1 hypothetical protein BAR24066_07382 [Burkholderia arboris]